MTFCATVLLTQQVSIIVKQKQKKYFIIHYNVLMIVHGTMFYFSWDMFMFDIILKCYFFLVIMLFYLFACLFVASLSSCHKKAMVALYCLEVDHFQVFQLFL